MRVFKFSLAALLASLAVVSIAAAADSFEVQVELEEYTPMNPSGGVMVAEGGIDSKRIRCIRDRVVRFWVEDRDGKRIVARTRSTYSGPPEADWSVQFPYERRIKRMYAKVRRLKTPGFVCKRDRSNVVDFT